MIAACRVPQTWAGGSCICMYCTTSAWLHGLLTTGAVGPLHLELFEHRSAHMDQIWLGRSWLDCYPTPMVCVGIPPPLVPVGGNHTHWGSVPCGFTNPPSIATWCQGNLVATQAIGLVVICSNCACNPCSLNLFKVCAWAISKVLPVP